MKLRPIHIILALSILTTASIIFLSIHSSLNRVPNGFSRRFIDAELKEINTIELANPVLSILGSLNGGYLFSCPEGEFLTTDQNLSNARFLRLIKDSAGVITSPFHTFLTRDKITIYSRPLRRIVYVDTKSRRQQEHSIPCTFSDAIFLSDSTSILRINSNDKRNKILCRLKNNSGKIIPENSISHVTNDLGFGNDGKLYFDPGLQRVIYLHFYCNEFICMDTNLSLIYRGRTIDTFAHFRSTAKVFTSLVGKKSASFSTPPKFVNTGADIFNQKMYIRSSVRADNESIRQFHLNTDIDVYQLSDGKYLGSFYIPAFSGSKLKHFKIISGYILALYSDRIIKYKCPI